MLLKNIFKGLTKVPLVTVICVLLLTAALLSMQFATALAGVTTAPRPETHLTIAVPMEGVDSKTLTSLVEIDRHAVTSARASDMRTLARAYSEGLIPYTPPKEQYYHAAWETLEIAVFVVKCTQVTSQSTMTMNTHRYQFEIEQIVAMHDVFVEDITVGSTVSMSTSKGGQAKDFEPYAEEGKRYLVWGSLEAYDSGESYRLDHLDAMYTLPKVEEQDGKHILYETVAYSGRYYPVISELGGTYEAFLSTEMGALWQETILPKTEVCYRSVTVIGTDEVESIPSFNLDRTVIVEGEIITEEQYAGGERVCLISDALAECNGLSVGDVLPLSFYPAGYPYGNWKSVSYYNTFDPDYGFPDTGDYRIVGIYHTEDVCAGEMDTVHPNTVYVPNASLTGAYDVVSAFYSVMQLSFIMKAGQEPTFETEMKGLGYGGLFEYYSGPEIDDAETKYALEQAQAKLVTDAEERAEPIYLAGAVMILLAAFGMMWKMKREIGIYYRIETPDWVLFWHILLQTVMVGALSLGLSHWLAGVILPTAVPSAIYDLAEPAFADRLTETLAEIPPLGETLLWGAAMMLVAFILFAAAGTKRTYHYQYREKE